jgi:hypothetical protein
MSEVSSNFTPGGAQLLLVGQFRSAWQTVPGAADSALAAAAPRRRRRLTES